MEDKFRAYLSGPITGIKHANKEAFTKAKLHLEKQGFEVFSPAENFGGVTLPSMRDRYMRKDLHMVLDTDVVVVLPAWKESRGALCEVFVAYEIGIPVLNLGDLSEVAEAEFWAAMTIYVHDHYNILGDKAFWPPVGSDTVTKG